MVVKSCKTGDITIIKTIQPMKLAMGSYRIIGTPVVARSRPGSKSIDTVGPQMMIIPSRVTDAVITAYRRTLRKTCGIDVVLKVIYLTTNHPTGKPNRIQKMGTPIPIPIQTTSRRTKIPIAQRGLNPRNFFIVACL
jgi:hypothetical protein